MNSHHLPIPLALAATLALAGSACNKSADAGEETKRSVRTADVALADVVDTIEMIGELQGIEEVRIMAQVPERIRSLMVREGDEVKAGANLIILAGELQAQGVKQADAAREAALANRDATRDELARVRTLVKAGTASRQQLEGLEARLRAADAQVRQLDAALSQASAQSSRTVIRSPINGVISGITLREGDLASPGIPILTVVQRDKLKVVLRVPERQFLRVKQGMPVRLSLLARPDIEVNAETTVVGSVVDRLTRTGLVEVHLDEPDANLVAGSAVRATIEVERRPQRVVAPASALIFTPNTDVNGEAIAFVLEGTTAKRRPITIGIRQGDQIEVVEGLEAGEQLVTSGAHLLRDGSEVKLANAAGNES